jgi:Histidine phosphatase superfamily (branch 1)
MVHFDSSMTETDEVWRPTTREGWDELECRIDAVLQWIVARPEENIMVVSHGVWIEAFLRRHQPSFLGDRRVYNLDAFGMQCVSQKRSTSTRRGFLRVQNVTKIV